MVYYTGKETGKVTHIRGGRGGGRGREAVTRNSFKVDLDVEYINRFSKAEK